MYYVVERCFLSYCHRSLGRSFINTFVYHWLWCKRAYFYIHLKCGDGVGANVTVTLRKLGKSEKKTANMPHQPLLLPCEKKRSKPIYDFFSFSVFFRCGCGERVSMSAEDKLHASNIHTLTHGSKNKKQKDDGKMQVSSGLFFSFRIFFFTAAPPLLLLLRKKQIGKRSGWRNASSLEIRMFESWLFTGLVEKLALVIFSVNGMVFVGSNLSLRLLQLCSNYCNEKILQFMWLQISFS